MKIAIHHRKNSFSERWISYCEQLKVDFTLVNCHDTNILKQLEKLEITHLMWHFSHEYNIDSMTFQNVLNAADLMGIKTFPSFNSRWHFDNKIAQKYLLEALKVPLIGSHVFYEEKKALEYIKNNTPIVAKLKKGAGANNVRLLKSYDAAQSYIRQMFGNGFDAIGKPLDNLNDKIRASKSIKNPIDLAKRTFRYLKRVIKENKVSEKEKGYVYFQDFVPNNEYDTRIITIGDKAFGLRRFNRKNDFRASGSGNIDFDSSKIDVNLVKMSFDISDRYNFECMAYDYLFDEANNPKIVEICFGFNVKAYDSCDGYWTKSLTFKHEKFNPQGWMMEDFLKKID